MESNYKYSLKLNFPSTGTEVYCKKAINFCKRNKIDEIICSIDFKSNNVESYYQRDEMQKLVDQLTQTGQELRAAGLGFGISPELGPMKKKYREGKLKLCPFTKEWNDSVSSFFAEVAKAHPDVVWINEDFRMFDSERQNFWFISDELLIRFAEKTGIKISAEELTEAITAPGEPHPWRIAWISLCGEIITEACKSIAEAVFSIDENITMGIMGSDIFAHNMEGRCWNDVMAALSGKTKAMFSPGSEDRKDNLPKNITFGQDNARASVALISEKALCASRLDSDGCGTFSKSIRFTRLQLGLAAIEGNNHTIINLFDELESGALGEEESEKMIRDEKGKLTALSNIDGKLLSEEGVYIPVVRNAPESYVVSEKGLDNGIDNMQNKGNLWSNVIQRFGIPVTFDTKSAGSPSVAAITGQSVRGMGHEEIMKLLSAGILMDASAAETLLDMGYGEYIGVRAVKRINTDDMAVGAEEAGFYVRDNIKIDYMTILWLTVNRSGDGVVTFTRFDLEKGAKAKTWVTDENRNRIFPGMIYYENSLGGRAAIHSCVMSEKTCVGQYNWGRAKAMTDTIKWLSKGRDFLCSPNNPDFFCLWRRYAGFDFVGFANIGYDDADEIVLETSSKDYESVKKVLICSQSGSWEPVGYEILPGSLAGLSAPENALEGALVTYTPDNVAENSTGNVLEETHTPDNVLEETQVNTGDSDNYIRIRIKIKVKFMDFGAVKIIRERKGVQL